MYTTKGLGMEENQSVTVVPHIDKDEEWLHRMAKFQVDWYGKINVMAREMTRRVFWKKPVPKSDPCLKFRRQLLEHKIVLEGH